MPVTTDSASPTWPTAIPHTPKASAAGIRLGTRLSRPILNERSANTRINEINTNASVVPMSMLLILRSPMLLNMMVGLAPSLCSATGRLSRIHCCAFLSSCNTVFVVMLCNKTVMRVADLSILIWLLKSSP